MKTCSEQARQQHDTGNDLSARRSVPRDYFRRLNNTAVFSGTGPTLVRAFLANAALFLEVERGKRAFDDYDVLRMEERQIDKIRFARGTFRYSMFTKPTMDSLMPTPCKGQIGCPYKTDNVSYGESQVEWYRKAHQIGRQPHSNQVKFVLGKVGLEVADPRFHPH